MKFTRQVIEDKDYVLRSITYMQLPDSVKEDLRTAVRTILDVYSTCIGELRDREVCMNESSLTVVYREWAFLLTNSKVRLVKDPCKALRRITRGVVMVLAGGSEARIGVLIAGVESEEEAREILEDVGGILVNDTVTARGKVIIININKELTTLGDPVRVETDNARTSSRTRMLIAH